MSYKAKIRIPKDQYAFIEVDVEGTVDEIKALYMDFMREENGLDKKEWNKALDLYLCDNGMEQGVHDRMSPEQQRMIHEIDKSLSRISKRVIKLEHD